MKTQFISTLALFAISLALSACSGPTDADKVADAQNCLDSSPSSEAPTCVSKVDGIETPSAYLIRCAGKFVKEGFSNPTKLAGTLNGVEGEETDNSGSTSMMASLAFKAESTPALNSASAKEAFTYCTKANSKGLLFLSGLTKTSTSLAALANSIGDLDNMEDLDGEKLKELMGSLQNDADAQEAVGSSIAAIYTSSCLNDGQTAGNFCEQFDSAAASVGGIENTSGLGQQVMKCYSDPTLPECAAFQ